MSIECDPPDRRTRQGQGVPDEPEAHQDESWYQEELSRAVQEKESKSPPAITKRLEMRRVCATAIRMECDRHLRDARLDETRLDHHFRCELHPRAPLIEPRNQIARKSSQSAVDVGHGCAKPAPSQDREHRISDPSMQERHG